MKNQEIMTRPVTEISQFSPSDVLNQITLIQEIMKNAMTEGEHFGVIPGCQKPSLLKPGAEKLGLTFRLEPEYEVYEHFLEKGHYYCRIQCTLKHILTGQRWGDGVGSCSTMETKYKYRTQNRKCPKCGQETIIQGKQDFGGGFICWQKKGGCGAKFPNSDAKIIHQKIGRVENEDLADQYNTILKMAKKRAHVDAMLTAVAASDIFTQDIEADQIQLKKSDIQKPQQDSKTEYTDNNLYHWQKVIGIALITINDGDQTRAGNMLIEFTKNDDGKYKGINSVKKIKSEKQAQFIWNNKIKEKYAVIYDVNSLLTKYEVVTIVDKELPFETGEVPESAKAKGE